MLMADFQFLKRLSFVDRSSELKRGSVLGSFRPRSESFAELAN